MKNTFDSESRIGTNGFLKIAAVVLIIILVFSVINVQHELSSLKEQREELANKISEVEDMIDEMNIRLNEPTNAEYIEKVAREQLGYRKDGEIIFYNDLAD